MNSLKGSNNLSLVSNKYTPNKEITRPVTCTDVGNSFRKMIPKKNTTITPKFESGAICESLSCRNDLFLNKIPIASSIPTVANSKNDFVFISKSINNPKPISSAMLI